MKSADYYRAVLFGVVLGMGFLSLFYVFLSPVENMKPAEALDSKGNFEVVDTYKGCDVVRYTVPIEAKYHYFLNCSNK
jgi:hypothetical protein